MQDVALWKKRKERSSAIRTLRSPLFWIALAITLLVAVPAVTAASKLVIPRNSVASPQIRDGSIQRGDLSRAAIDYLTAGAPTPRARGVTVTAGTRGDRMRVLAPNLRSGSVLGQMEYLGGLTCPDIGPWLRVEGTFFDASGLVVAASSDSELSPVAGVRYPLDVLGDRAAVRAELVATVECL